MSNYQFIRLKQKLQEEQIKYNQDEYEKYYKKRMYFSKRFYLICEWVLLFFCNFLQMQEKVADEERMDIVILLSDFFPPQFFLKPG